MSDEQPMEMTEEVIEKISEAAPDFVRALNKAKIQFTTLGYALGAATGAFVAWKLAFARAETKFAAVADEEIAEMRKHYNAKLQAAEAQAQKLSPVKDIVTERGYVTDEDGEEDVKPPMAVAPPTEVVEAANETSPEELLRKPPVPVDPTPPAEVRNVFRHAEEEANVVESWSYKDELRRRSSDAPYVIHYDERYEFEGYSEMTLTYYERDDVLCNERDEVIGKGEEREAMIGEANLNRFGHGSNDPSIVYIRNDKLELVLEVVRSPNSYAEEVHGFTHQEYGRNLEKMRRREREGLDDS